MKKTTYVFITMCIMTSAAFAFCVLSPDASYTPDILTFATTILLPATAATFPWTRTEYAQVTEVGGKTIIRDETDTQPAMVRIVSPLLKPITRMLLRLVSKRGFR